MGGDDRSSSQTLLGRRTFLGAAGAGAVSLAAAGTASAYHESFDEVYDVVEEGADDTGRESINPVIDDLRGDSVLLKFRDGRYRMDREFRHTSFDAFGMTGVGATIVPDSADDWNGDERRLFKLGTGKNPGDRLRIEGLTFDFTAPNTGLRAIQAQVADPYVRRVTVEGRHDTGNWAQGPLLVDVTDPDGTGRVERVNLKDGGEIVHDSDSFSLGPIGFAVSPDHRGTLHVDRCRIFRFPSNGFYCSSERGRVVIRRGRYRDNNVANIRLAGDHSEIRGAHVVIRENPDGWNGQVGIRLDEGSNFLIDDIVMWAPRPNGNGIRITGDAGSARIQNSLVTFGNGKDDAVFVDDGCGPVTIVDSEIRKRGRGQAVQIQSADEEAPVVMWNVTINGDAPGGNGGSHAIRCERDNCEFHWLHVDQPGPHYRRCISINADDCIVVGGRFTSTHHPIVVDADGVAVRDVKARAYNDSEGVKVTDGNDGVKVVNSTVWNGIENRGSDVDTWGNDYPDS